MRLLPAIALAISLIALGLFISSDVAVAAHHDVAVVRFKLAGPNLVLSSGVPGSKAFMLQVQNQSLHHTELKDTVRVVVVVFNPDPANCSVDGVAVDANNTIIVDELVDNALSPYVPATFGGEKVTITCTDAAAADGLVFGLTARVDHADDDDVIIPSNFDDEDVNPADNDKSNTLVVKG